MKRSILFGVLAMFAVSAMSVQNLNAQDVNEETKSSQSTTNAINEPKVKPADPATTKVQPKTQSSTNAINEPKVKPQASDDANTKEPAMRTMENPKGAKDVTVQKVDKKQDVLDRTTGKKTIKKNRPKKMTKNEKMENNTQSGVAKPNQNQQGNESNKIQKPGKNDKMENNTQSGVAKPNEAQGNEGKKMVKPGKNDKIENNTQSSQQTKPNEGQGNENDTKKNVVKPKFQKSEPKPQPNSVPRPKQQKSKEGTGTENNNGAI